jgi:hypothetical protein
MSEKERILRMQPSGRWAVCRPGRDPVEITSGELFRVDVNGELKVTRMEFREFSRAAQGPREPRPAWRVLFCGRLLATRRPARCDRCLWLRPAQLKIGREIGN